MRYQSACMGYPLRYYACGMQLPSLRYMLVLLCSYYAANNPVSWKGHAIGTWTHLLLAVTRALDKVPEGVLIPAIKVRPS